MGRIAFEYTERLRARGHNVHVFTPRYEHTEGDPEYVHRVPSPIHFGNAGVTPSLVRRLSGFDLIHLHYPFFGGAEPVIIGKALRPNQKLVITYHMDAVADGVRGAIFEAHRRLLFPWLMGRAQKILVSSRDYADQSALAKLPGIMERTEVHPFGVDLERFHPGLAPVVRERLQIPDGVPTMIFVGGLDPAHHFKGFPVLLEALSGLTDVPWHLIVVGDGALRSSFEALAKERGCAHRIHFVGGASDEDLPLYYRAANIHVFPSTERAEAFGIVALESAASGIPCIASNLDGVRTVVKDGETGMLVAPRDVESLRTALRLLLEDPDECMRLGVLARARAEREFSWGGLIDRLESTYSHLV